MYDMILGLLLFFFMVMENVVSKGYFMVLSIGLMSFICCVMWKMFFFCFWFLKSVCVCLMIFLFLVFVSLVDFSFGSVKLSMLMSRFVFFVLGFFVVFEVLWELFFIFIFFLMMEL